MKLDLDDYLPLAPATLHILLSLAGEPMHGYGIMQEVLRQSGGYQGALLAIERPLRGKRPPADDWDWTYPFRATLTFVLALVGWVFFRAADLAQSVQGLGQRSDEDT